MKVSFGFLLSSIVVISASTVSRQLLFIDNEDVLFTAGLSRKLKPLKRRIDPVVVPEFDYEGLLAYNAVHFIDGEYRMWYQSYSTSLDVTICYATSSDGIHWTKPKVGLNGTNILVVNDGGLYLGDVLYDTREKNASRVYKMIVFDQKVIPGVTQYTVPGMYVLFSSDGIEWEKMASPALVAAYGGSPVTLPPFEDEDQENYTSGPINNQWLTPLSMSDVMNIFYDTSSNEYVCFHKTWIDGPSGENFWKRAVARSTSKDFVTWSRDRHLVLYPDEFDGPSTSYLPGVGNVGVELHGGPVFETLSGDVQLMLLEILNWTSTPNSGDLNCELGVSRDKGKTWSRPFRKSQGYDYFFATNSRPGTFDSGTLWMSSSPVRVGNVTRIYYGAYSSWNVKLPCSNCTGIGVATMFEDRFAAITNTNSSFPGQLTTKPVSFQGICSMTANVDTSLGGTLQFEILNEYGYRVRGFDRSHHIPISNRTNDVAVNVEWVNASISTLSNKNKYSVRVLFSKGQSQIYALSLESC